MVIHSSNPLTPIITTTTHIYFTLLYLSALLSPHIYSSSLWHTIIIPPSLLLVNREETLTMVHHHQHHEVSIPGEIPIPHGPTTGDDSDDFPVGTDAERRIFSHVTRPEDSYTSDGVYWADLPWMQRLKFVSKVDRETAAEELRTTGRMVKEDPLSPLSWYFRHAVIPGAGLGLEGYVLFSIGNLEPLFASVWGDCWGKDATDCSKNWISSVTYLEIIGIMVGQVFVGVSQVPSTFFFRLFRRAKLYCND